MARVDRDRRYIPWGGMALGVVLLLVLFGVSMHWVRSDIKRLEAQDTTLQLKVNLMEMNYADLQLELQRVGNHIGELAYAGGFNHYPVRSKFTENLLQCLGKIANQCAANAAGIHLRNFHTGILQKAAVNANFAKFVLNQHDFLPGIDLLQHFFDKRSLACPQKTGINIDFRHKSAPSY